MENLEQIFRNLDMGNNDNTTDDINKIVVKAISSYLDIKPILTNHEINEVLKNFINDSNITTIKYRSDAEKYFNPSFNIWMKTTNEFKRDSLSDALRLFLKDKYPKNCKIGTLSYSKKGSTEEKFKRGGGTVLYYRDQEKLFDFLRERISDEPIMVLYNFNVDELF